MPRDESWYFFLTDPGNNAVIAWDKVTLMEAEKEGFAHPEAFEGEASTTGSKAGGKPSSNGYVLVDNADKQQEVESEEGELGQEVEFVFMGPKAGKYDLVLQVMSDCWVGADVSIPVKLKVNPLGRAEAEGRDPKSKALAKQWASDTESEDGEDRSEGSSAGSESGSDKEGDDYDSEETGEEESDEDNE